jgi:DNA mismatch endonuclease (patch repair protein)
MERHHKSMLEKGVFERVDPARSFIMGRIKGKSNRTTEVRLRMALVRAGISGWELHDPSVRGRPDFFFSKSRVAVFVDGCFWHGCPRCGHIPRTRSAFWEAKFQRNKTRDARNGRALRKDGIVVIRVWEHSLKNQIGVKQAVARIRRHLP